MSPLIRDDVVLPSGRPATIPIYKPDPLGVKDSNEIVMISVHVVPSEAASSETAP